jgi:hypothetical protein
MDAHEHGERGVRSRQFSEDASIGRHGEPESPVLLRNRESEESSASERPNDVVTDGLFFIESCGVDETLSTHLAQVIYEPTNQSRLGRVTPIEWRWIGKKQSVV